MNQTSDYELTIIVPAFNEEGNAERLENRLSAFLEKSVLKACVLFVDDASTDSTLQRFKEICSRHPAFFYISMDRNGGLSAALKAGIREVFSPYTGYIDADLQTDPEDFNLLAGKIGDHQLVTGVRADRKDSGFKKLQSRIANGYRRMMTHDGATDTGCPLKIMHTSYARELPLFTGMHRFLPALIQMMGGKVCEIPVRHYPREAGVSKYHLWNRLAGPFMDCFAFRWMKKRYVGNHPQESNLDK